VAGHIHEAFWWKNYRQMPVRKLAVVERWLTEMQARNQLGTPGGAKSFLRGAQNF